VPKERSAQCGNLPVLRTIADDCEREAAATVADYAGDRGNSRNPHCLALSVSEPVKADVASIADR
jgi:hypothetical protein